MAIEPIKGKTDPVPAARPSNNNNKVEPKAKAGETQATESRAMEPSRDVAKAESVTIEISGEKRQPEAEEQLPSSSEINQAVSDLSQLVQDENREINFFVDKNSGDFVVQVVDSESKEVIRQIPQDEILRLAERLNNTSGFLLNEQG